MSSKSTSRTKSTSSRLKRDARVMSQTPIDAKLHVDFEHSERQFDYSTSIDVNASTSTSNVPSSTVSAYLQKIQRGSHIQPFGCVIAIHDQTLAVLAYSENTLEMLDLAPHAVPSIEQQEVLTFGTDVRTLFSSSSVKALEKAFAFPEVSLLNPVLVHCRSSGKPFYAILHRDDVGIIIDLEPVNPAEVPVTAAGALKSYKLAAKAISRLQGLQSGNVSRLCDVLVKEVRELTGYDRVMVYKFHEDLHGEVIAECRKQDLDPYLGLHYPATDIPQASRSLFMRNKVRVIYDCLAQPVKVVQTESLSQPLNLSGSALRAPHGCHSQYMENMGSIASLVMAVTINDGDEDDDDDDGNESQSEINLQETQKGQRLWGLVVCHHSSARFVSFPLRYACEFLIQVFGVQINKEVELTAQQREKHILKTQTVLCDMLLRDAPTGIMTQSPNVMDLVTCDGAALYYKDRLWLLGITPTESQVKDIANWLLEEHVGSTGLSTDSLTDIGYPGASILGKAVCGMAAVKITSKDFLFWFRSHAAKEVKWGGAKHDPDDNNEGRKMHPRSSFKAFLEVVKNRSLPWEDVEMDAIHSLQLILRGSLPDDDGAGGDDVAGDEESNDKKIVRVPDVDMSIQRVDELRVVANEMVRLIETASAPVFAVDGNGNISGWNDKIAEITGLPLDQAVGVSLADLVVDDSADEVKAMLSSALRGIEEKNVEIKFKCFGSQEKDDHITVVTNACCSRDLKQTIVGVCFVGQDLTAQKMITEKYTKAKGDFSSIIRSPCALIPPIFMMDEYGKCFEWNDAMVKITGLPREEANNKMLLGEVFSVGDFGCRVKDDMLTRLRILLNEVISGLDPDKLVFGFYDQNGKYVEGLLSANKRINGEGKVTGVLCFIHVASPELQHAIMVQRMSEQAALNSLTKVSYLKHELKNGLNGIKFIEDLMESELCGEQRRILHTSCLSREQLEQIVDDSDIESIEQCYMEVKCAEFKLGEALEVVLNQVKNLSRERKVEVVFDAPEQLSSLSVYGDNLRVQQVLSDFLSNALSFTPNFEGSSVLFRVTHKMEHIGVKIQVAHVEFRITHPSPGMPEKLIQDMFHSNRSVSREGLGLYISQRLVKIMNGSVQYLREAERASFIILIEFPVSPLSTSDNKRSKRT